MGGGQLFPLCLSSCGSPPVQDSELRAKFQINLDSAHDFDWVHPDYLHLMRNNNEARDLIQDEFQTLLEDLRVLRSEVLTTGESKINLPVNLKRLIWNAQIKFNCRAHR